MSLRFVVSISISDFDGFGIVTNDGAVEVIV